jgi:hypothetical protein
MGLEGSNAPGRSPGMDLGVEYPAGWVALTITGLYLSDPGFRQLVPLLVHVPETDSHR